MKVAATLYVPDAKSWRKCARVCAHEVQCIHIYSFITIMSSFALLKAARSLYSQTHTHHAETSFSYSSPLLRGAEAADDFLFGFVCVHARDVRTQHFVLFAFIIVNDKLGLDSVHEMNVHQMHIHCYTRQSHLRVAQHLRNTWMNPSTKRKKIDESWLWREN